MVRRDRERSRRAGDPRGGQERQPRNRRHLARLRGPPARAADRRLRRAVPVDRQRREHDLLPHQPGRPDVPDHRHRRRESRARPVAGGDPGGDGDDGLRRPDRRPDRGELPEGRDEPGAPLRARRDTGGGGRPPGDRHRDRIPRGGGLSDHLLLLLQLGHAASDVPVRRLDRKERAVPPTRGCFRSRRLRRRPGLLRESGRHPGADVPRVQEGLEARRLEPDAALRLRRLQHLADPALPYQLAPLDGDGRRCGGAEPARWWRVRRGVARGGDQAEEAERLRRLHRRRRVADRE